MSQSTQHCQQLLKVVSHECNGHGNGACMLPQRSKYPKVEVLGPKYEDMYSVIWGLLPPYLGTGLCGKIAVHFLLPAVVLEREAVYFVLRGLGMKAFPSQNVRATSVGSPTTLPTGPHPPSPHPLPPTNRLIIRGRVHSVSLFVFQVCCSFLRSKGAAGWKDVKACDPESESSLSCVEAPGRD